MKGIIKQFKEYLRLRYLTYGFYVVCAVKKGEERAYLRYFMHYPHKILYPSPMLENKIKTEAKVDAVVILNITRIPTYLFMLENPGFITTLIEGAIVIMSQTEKK